MRVSALALLLSILSWSGGAQAQATPVIAPGNEAVVGRMLGGELPAGCSFEGASIEARRVVGRYRCDGEAAEVELRHPDDPAGGAARTDRFRVGGEAPAALLEAVRRSARAEEGAFEWSEAAGPAPEATSAPSSDEPAPPSVSVPTWVPLGAAGLLAILMLGIALRGPEDGAPSPARLGTHELAGLAGVLLVGLGLRLAAAWLLPWDTDEVSSLPSGGWRALLTEDHDLLLHPPLHRLALAAVPGLGSCPPRWLPRLPSVLASVAALFAVFAAARPRLGPRGALLPALMVTLTPFDVFIGALARPYAFAACAMVVCAGAAWAAAEGRARRAHWVALCGGIGVLAWTDYLATALAVAMALAALLLRRARGRPTGGASAVVVASAAMGLAPWLPFVAAGIGFYASRHGASGPLQISPLLALVRFGADATGGVVSCALTGLLVLGGLLRRRARPVAIAALLLAAAVVVGSQTLYLRPRNLALAAPLWALAACVGWQALREARARLAVVVAGVLLLARLGQLPAVVHTERAPPTWASELRLGWELASLGARLPIGREPVLVDVDHDAAILPRNLFSDRCEPPVVEAHDPAVTRGEGLGRVHGCEVPSRPAPFLYLRRHRCPEEPPPRCSLRFREANARVYLCAPAE